MTNKTLYLFTPILRIAKTLYEWDITHFDDRNPPITDALRKQKIHTFDPTFKYINDLLTQGYFEFQNEHFEFSDWISKTSMYEDFKHSSSNIHFI